MADILFIALAFFAITGAIAMLVYKSPMFSALGLLITMLSVAGMFALLNATLLFMVQIIVYAGAIMALILFILMFLNIKEEDLPQEPNKYKLIVIGAFIMIPLNVRRERNHRLFLAAGLMIDAGLVDTKTGELNFDHEKLLTALKRVRYDLETSA